MWLVPHLAIPLSPLFLTITLQLLGGVLLQLVCTTAEGHSYTTRLVWRRLELSGLTSGRCRI